MNKSIGISTLFAALLGLVVGIFFGPLCDYLKPLGVAFTMLLRMVMLPYLCFALIQGLGSLTPPLAKKLFRMSWPFFALLWGIMIFLLVFLIQIIPSISPSILFLGSSSNFLSNFLSYVIPDNPFYDFANNFVPAIAAFSLIIGGALLHLDAKEPLLSILDRTVQSIEKIFQWIIAISPVGIFAHIAVAVGTIYLEDLLKLEFYVIAFLLVSLFVTFWIFPLILSSFTPLSFREILHAYHEVCLIPFLAGLSTLSFPFLYFYLQKLPWTENKKDVGETTRTIVPIAYSFGQIGNCLILFFILFLSFYYRQPLGTLEKSLLWLIAIPASVGSSAVSFNSVAFLVDQLHFPSGAGELYMQMTAVTYNFQVLLNTASILALILLTIHAYYGHLQIKWRQFFVRIGSTLALFAVITITFEGQLHLGDHYRNLYQELSIAEVIPDPVEAKILAKGERGTYRDPSKSTLAQIMESGVLKVGFDDQEPPYAYRNQKNDLVGYDIAYAYQLAKELDCNLEFIPVSYGGGDSIGLELEEGLYDVAMSSFLMTEYRLRNMSFSNPYSAQDTVLIVPRSKKDQFRDFEAIAQMKGLRVGTGGAYNYIFERHFPNAISIPIYYMESFLQGEADAVLWSKVSAYVWCLENPNYVAMDYGDMLGKLYLAYPTKPASYIFESFLNEWLALKEQSGFKTQMEHYWIDGQPPENRAPRWSILRNVLGVGKKEDKSP